MAAPTITLTTSGTDPKIATVENLETTVNSAFSSLYDQVISGDDAHSEGTYFAGPWDASVGTFPSARTLGGAVQNGDFFSVSVAGTVDGQSFAVGDRLLALIDAPSSTVYAANWYQAATIAALGPINDVLDIAPYAVAEFSDLSALTYVLTPTNRIIEISDTGYKYQVKASGVTDGHIPSAGVVLYVLPSDDGSFALDAFGPDGTRAGDSAVIRTALRAANGAPVRLGAKRYYYDGTAITRDKCVVWGAGMPDVNAGKTALEGGSIIDGTFAFTSADLDLRDFGVDCGSASTATEGDGIRGTATLNAGGHLHTENLVALCKSRSSAFHALLFQSYQRHTGGNLYGTYGLFGFVSKSRNTVLTSIETVENASAGVLLKSDTGFGTCSQFQCAVIRCVGFVGQDHGLQIQSSDVALRKVGIGSVHVSNCVESVKVQVGASGTDVRDVNIAEIRSDIAFTSDLTLDCINASGAIFGVNVGNMITSDTREKAVRLEGSGTISGFKLGSAFVSYAVTATQATMDGAVLIGSNATYTDIDEITICRNYSLSLKGGIVYNNAPDENILGSHRANLYGTGRPYPGYSAPALSGTTATITVPVNPSGADSLVRAVPASGTIVTTFAQAVTAASNFQRGHRLAIINNSANSMDISHVPGSGIVNTGSATVTLATNDAVSYVYSGSAWHQS